LKGTVIVAYLLAKVSRGYPIILARVFGCILYLQANNERLNATLWQISGGICHHLERPNGHLLSMGYLYLRDICQKVDNILLPWTRRYCLELLPEGSG
jgi:hypothetical protein